jgi:hypothetical protein
VLIIGGIVIFGLSMFSVMAAPHTVQPTAP